MENYTKYKLKSSDELASVLDGKDNLFVIACNKCFKEFETVDEPDCDEFLKFAADQRKKITGSDSGRYRECSSNFLWPWYSDRCGSGR